MRIAVLQAWRVIVPVFGVFRGPFDSAFESTQHVTHSHSLIIGILRGKLQVYA